jgi:pimeloyl-ACP methyl ester carboxylesterase
MSHPIFFSPGNGFPSDAYQALFQHLSPYADIDSLAMSGHDVNYPVCDNWLYLAHELIAAIKAQHPLPVIGIGHSMGGVLMFMAASLEPQLFSRIILLDSPIIGPVRSYLLKTAKRLRVLPHFMPISQSGQRRQCFDSKETAFHHFQSKPLFRHFSKEALWTYIHAALVERDSGFYLRFDRDVESAIFNTVPDNLYRYKLRAQIPAHLLYSSQGSVITQHDLRHMQKHYGFQVEKVNQGGHLFPLEAPELTAWHIKRLITDPSDPF